MPLTPCFSRWVRRFRSESRSRRRSGVRGVQIGGMTPPIAPKRADVSLLSATMIVESDLLLSRVHLSEGARHLRSALAVLIAHQGRLASMHRHAGVESQNIDSDFTPQQYVTPGPRRERRPGLADLARPSKTFRSRRAMLTRSAAPRRHNPASTPDHAALLPLSEYSTPRFRSRGEAPG